MEFADIEKAMEDFYTERSRSMEYSYGFFDALGVIRELACDYSTRITAEKQSFTGKKMQNEATGRELIIQKTISLLWEAPWRVLVFVYQYLLA